MKKMKPKHMILLFLSPFLLFGLYVVVVLIYGSMNDWKPEEKTTITVQPTKQGVDVVSDSVFTFFTWNVGYAGLGAEADFFYDGGTMVRSTKNNVEKYIGGIEKTLSENNNATFILLQEVDKHSKRSYYNDEFALFQKQTKNYFGSFALNFNVKFVPKKYFEPIGHVESGLASFSKHAPTSAMRFQFPGEFSWPLRLFNLDRCFLASRFLLQNGKELIVVNTHNSAYDNGSMKQQEMEYLKTFLLHEYENGNYIVVGGDWNQCPPGFQWDAFTKSTEPEDKPIMIDRHFMPEGWTWIFDKATPTNRKLKKAYEAEKTFTTIIDFYLLSPNMEATEVRGLALAFANSDHQPVRMTCKLK
jgi:endonuclease/exonuclease/phosphatase family metal-dependent hydrolase